MKWDGIVSKIKEISKKINKKIPIALIAIIAITLLGTFIFAYISFITIKNEIPPSIYTIWNNWDAPSYITLAKNGYSEDKQKQFLMVILPLYPFLINLFSKIFQDHILTSILISNISYIFATIYLYKLVLLDYSKKKALRTVIYFSIFPTAYFLHTGYTESLFLALTISSFYYARKGNWFLSSFLGMFATGTRLTGIFLFPTLIIEYLSQKKFNIKKIKKEILWIAIVPLGFLIYLIINYSVFGDPFYFTKVQKENFGITSSSPWIGVSSAWGSMHWRQPAEKVIIGLMQLIFAIIATIFCIHSLLKFRYSYSVYMILTWGVIASTNFWIGIPRYVLILFPMFIALSNWGEKEELNYTIMFISILLQGLFITLFMRGGFTF